MRIKLICMVLVAVFVFFHLSPFISANQDQENHMEDIKIGEETVGKSIKLESKILDMTVHLLIFLPAGYEKTQAKYPVVFSFRHYQFTSGILSWHFPRMILVDFSNVNYEYFSLYPEKNRSGFGSAEKMLRFIKDELVPFIDSNFRTLHYRLLMGGSSGGIFSIYAILSEPELIDSAFAAGPMFAEFDWERVSEILEKALQNRRSHDNKLYFTAGDQPELLPYIRLFQGLLNKYQPQGLKWKYDPAPGETHLTIGVRTFFDGLKWLFADYTVLPDTVIRGGKEAVLAHVKSLERKFGGFDVSRITNLILTNTLNSRRMQKDYKNAVTVAKLYIEIVPESPFPLFHFAQTLAEMGEKEAAKEYYELAIANANQNRPGFSSFIRIKLDNLLRGKK